MNQLHFQVRPGSAARLNEHEERTLPQQLRGVCAGSAARETENRNREEGHSAGASGFSLRAQGGSVIRRDAGTVPGKNLHSIKEDPQAARGKSFAISAEIVRPGKSQGEAAPSATSVPLLHRLRTLFE